MRVNLKALKEALFEAHPFPHIVVENFLTDPRSVSDEFLPFDSERWLAYNTPVQIKKACNNWYAFPPKTYQLFSYLLSPDFTIELANIFGWGLIPDVGLHGGGWHIHGDGGVLSPHLDYSIHPRMKLERKLNLIVYLEPGMRNSYGGALGLWKGTDTRPEQLVREIAPLYNRAVIFDTTHNSWHGMSQALRLPKGVYRKSIAVYYLQPPAYTADADRDRAQFWEGGK